MNFYELYLKLFELHNYGLDSVRGRILTIPIGLRCCR